MLVRANHFRGEQLEYFRSTGSISGVYTAILAVFRVSVLRILCIFPSISGFDTADTPVLAVLLLLILPVMALFRPSVLLILPVLAVRNVLETPEYTRSTKYTGKFYPQRSSGQAVVTGVVPSPLRYVPSFLSRIGFSIPTARRFSSNVANSRFRAFR